MATTPNNNNNKTIILVLALLMAGVAVFLLLRQTKSDTPPVNWSSGGNNNIPPNNGGTNNNSNIGKDWWKQILINVSDALPDILDEFGNKSNGNNIADNSSPDSPYVLQDAPPYVYDFPLFP